MNGSNTVSWTINGNVASVVLDRPPYNHVDLEVMTSLADTLEALDTDDRCRAVVLTTVGKVFCGGADLISSDGLLGGGEAGLGSFYRQAARLFGTGKPIVAAVQGAAVGAGLGLALVADFRVAAPEARFAANFVKLGFHAGFGITHTLPRVVGLQRAALMLQTGRRIAGGEALTWGLVDAVAPLQELIGAAQALAAEIAQNAPLAVEATRATLRAGLVEAFFSQTRHELTEQARLMATDDFAEGVRAVSERRAGAFIRQ